RRAISGSTAGTSWCGQGEGLLDATRRHRRTGCFHAWNCSRFGSVAPDEVDARERPTSTPQQLGSPPDPPDGQATPRLLEEDNVSDQQPTRREWASRTTPSLQGNEHWWPDQLNLNVLHQK